MRLLIVEDDPLLASGLRDTLRREGYVVDAVPSAEHAEAALKVADIGLVILDTLSRYWEIKDENDNAQVMEKINSRSAASPSPNDASASPGMGWILWELDHGWRARPS